MLSCFTFFSKKFVVGDSGDGDTWDDMHMFCPNQCVCQRSPFMDLSVARWIQGLRREDIENNKKDTEHTYGGIFNDVTCHEK